jgi:hypothetical protein
MEGSRVSTVADSPTTPPRTDCLTPWVNDLLETRDGVYWIATDGGVCRFNPKQSIVGEDRLYAGGLFIRGAFRNMRPATLFFVGGFFSAACTALASPIVYAVNVNTSSISGTAGSLDFNFNPGPLVSQAASLEILSFASNGTLAGAPMPIGDVSGGPLPATLTFDNGGGFTDYFQGFTFASTLTFQVSLFGPALSSPDGVSTSGSTFAFSMFSDAAGTMPTLTSNAAGFAFTVDENLDGTTSVSNFSRQTTVTAQTPEPGGFALAGADLAAWAAARLTRRPKIISF